MEHAEQKVIYLPTTPRPGPEIWLSMLGNGQGDFDTIKGYLDESLGNKALEEIGSSDAQIEKFKRAFRKREAETLRDKVRACANDYYDRDLEFMDAALNDGDLTLEDIDLSTDEHKQLRCLAAEASAKRWLAKARSATDDSECCDCMISMLRHLLRSGRKLEHIGSSWKEFRKATVGNFIKKAVA